MSILKTKSPYILLILLLLGSFLLFSGWSARQAATRGSQIADPDYYSKGLKYNGTRVEERAAASQGWQLTTSIRGHLLSFELSDNAGAFIPLATGQLTLYLSEQKEVLRLPTEETQPGHYQLNLPVEITGSAQARIEFELQGARISRQLLVNL